MGTFVNGYLPADIINKLIEQIANPKLYVCAIFLLVSECMYVSIYLYISLSTCLPFCLSTYLSEKLLKQFGLLVGGIPH